MKPVSKRHNQRYLGMSIIQLATLIALGVIAIFTVFGAFGLILYISQPISALPLPAQDYPTTTILLTNTRLPSLTQKASKTPIPTNTRRPIDTKTPKPTSTPVLYIADARDFVLKESEIPSGFFILPGYSNYLTANTQTGFLSGYTATYKNGNSGIAGVLQTTGYTFTTDIYVFDTEKNAAKEYEYRSNLTKDTEDAIVSSAGDKELNNCDKAHLLIGVYNEEGFLINSAAFVFQKENVVGVVTSVGTAGAPSLGIPVDIDTATINRINEASYYTDLVLDKIQ